LAGGHRHCRTGPPAIAAPSSATSTPGAAVALFGQFIAAGFQAAADSSGLGTDITYQPQQTASLLAAPLHHRERGSAEARRDEPTVK
jgi:hypothetical protein